MAPEWLLRTQLSEVGWQSIPRSRSCDAECSVSELPIGPWHNEIATACRSEGGSSGYVGSGRQQVTYVMYSGE